MNAKLSTYCKLELTYLHGKGKGTMSTLATFIPSMIFPLPSEHEFTKVPTSTSTAPYQVGIPPPNQEGRPAFIICDPSLPHRMLVSLQAYLQTAPGRQLAPSAVLIQAVAGLERSLRGYVLDHETSSNLLFHRTFNPISCAVEEVDSNPSQPVTTTRNTLFNQIPDGTYRPHRDADAQLHVEFKSWTAFSHHATNILQLGRNSTVLELSPSETGHRSIIFKVC